MRYVVGMRTFMTFTVLLISPGVVACHPPKSPGSSVGTYQIAGTLKENTCGQAAVPVETILNFDVDIRRDSPLGYWRIGDNPWVEGLLSNAGQFSFQISGSWIAANADPGLAYPGCVLEQTDRIEGTFGSELPKQDPEDDAENSSPEEWSGLQDVDIAPVAGSDCDPVLSTSGGSFAVLPCRIAYDLLGTLLSE